MVTAGRYAVVDVPVVSRLQVVSMQEHVEPLFVTIEVFKELHFALIFSSLFALIKTHACEFYDLAFDSCACEFYDHGQIYDHDK